MKEKIKVIKENIDFNNLPIKFQNQIIDDEAKTILISFDDGVYTKTTAKKDAKNYYQNQCENKYVHYISSIYGECYVEHGKESWI